MIVHVVPAVSKEASGPSYSVVRLCDSLISAGEDVNLVTLDWSPFDSPPEYMQSFPLSWGPRKLGRSSSMRQALAASCAKGNVELLHNHSLWMMPNVYTGWVANRYRVPLVVSPRGAMSAWAMGSGSPVKRAFWPLVQRPALSSVACFHATAIAEYRDIRRLGMKQPIAIIPNGVDIPVSSHAQPRGDRVLLFLGRMHPVKGLDMLLPAWRRVQHKFPEWRLRIVGADDGNYLSVVQELASKLQVQRVEFVGPLFGKDKWHAYQGAALFILPSYSENFGMAVAEALATGTPCIVTKGAPWEGLETRQAGWWVDTDTGALETCLNAALSRSEHELREMGSRGRQWMQAEFSWSSVASMMAATYHWILAGGEAPSWVKSD